MKVVLAGAFGHLGSDILRELVQRGHEVVAVDRVVNKPEDCADGYEVVVADVCKPKTLKGVCEGADVVISTVGLVKASATITSYDVDYRGNLNLLAEAKLAGVKNFAYVSVIKADMDSTVPMLDAKAKFENELRASGLNWVIFRPTGYFYDMANVFMPMVEKGAVTLLGSRPIYANLVDTPDLARFIVEHMLDGNEYYSVGGREVWSYEEIARMFFAAAGKEPVIKRAPVAVFDVLALANKAQKNGKDAIIRFSKWTLTHDMVGLTIAGEASFAEYIQSLYEGRPTSEISAGAKALRPMREYACDDARRAFDLTEREIGEFKTIKGKGMTFQTQVFEAEGAGQLFVMTMSGMAGLMKMETVVFSPVHIDAPILSMDVVEALGSTTLVLEVYDTTLAHPAFDELEVVKARYAELPGYEPEEQPYSSLLLPSSDHKKGKKLREQLSAYGQEFSSTYFKLLEACQHCDPGQKKSRNAKLTESLIANGGPAVNQFKKMIGAEKTAEFLRTCMFCSARETGE